jgi:hypothetical protein
MGRIKIIKPWKYYFFNKTPFSNQEHMFGGRIRKENSASDLK